MNIEANRLSTFSNWPNTAEVEPTRIAKAGFYYTGQGVEVQCFSCGGKISDWNYGDQVMVRHNRLDPNCTFIVNPESSGNVALLPSGQTGTPVPEEVIQLTNPVTDYGVTSEDQMYQSDALRLLSFANWIDNSVSREALVIAGFYHAGEGRLRCAWCGGELEQIRRLGSLGTPLEIHRRYFPGCQHAAMLVARQETFFLSPTSPSYTPPAMTPPTIASSPDVAPTASDGSTPSPHHAQSSGAMHNSLVLASGAGGGTWRALGVVGGAGGCKHPARASPAARLASFAGWPRDRTQTPDALADAGFFYIGSQDMVRCFYCDGGLGSWEAGDEPWREHARWFPHCGYLLLLKGKDFVDQCQRGAAPTLTTSVSDTGISTRRINSGNRINFPFTETQVAECMEGAAAAAALGAGLDAARVRRAIVRRLQATGLPFSSAEGLIDAVLDGQLGEEAWSESPHSQRFARDILAETLRDFVPAVNLIPTSQWDDRSDSRTSESSARSLSPPAPSETCSEPRPQQSPPKDHSNKDDSQVEVTSEPSSNKTLTLEEENRQLKEARICKVCMDNEVGVVFLPCGHVAACARCGAGLRACPLCRAPVHALVRAYLA